MEELLVNLISAGAGVILSLVFEWFPGVSTWFEGLAKTTKQIIVGAVMFVVGAAIVGASCVGLLSTFFPNIVVTCDLPGVWAVVIAWLSAAGAAQSSHVLINKPIHAIRGK